MVGKKGFFGRFNDHRNAFRIGAPGSGVRGFVDKWRASGMYSTKMPIAPVSASCHDLCSSFLFTCGGVGLRWVQGARPSPSIDVEARDGQGGEELDCAFCDEFNGFTEENWIIENDGSWVVLPTIGSFTPGYCLLMPFEHVTATADLPPHALTELEHRVDALRKTLTGLYGPVVVAEHGPRGCDLGAGCCDHSHLHFIPVPDPARVLAAYEKVGGATRPHESLTHMVSAVNSSYVYLSVAPGEHYVWPAARFANQFVRRVCAALHGRAEHFDWRDYPYAENRRETMRTMGAMHG
jgi:diadenosine tetraphosphate (Ap4A) HIT family hydrolase